MVNVTTDLENAKMLHGFYLQQCGGDAHTSTGGVSVHIVPITHIIKPSRQPKNSHRWYVYSTAVVKRCQY